MGRRGDREAEEAEREEGTGRGERMGVREQKEQGKQAHVASFYSVGRRAKNDRHYVHAPFFVKFSN